MDVGWVEFCEGMRNTGEDMQRTESQEMGQEDQEVGAEEKKDERPSSGLSPSPGWGERSQPRRQTGRER